MVLRRGVFPELRRKCARRFVTFTEVDLRRGITEAQAEVRPPNQGQETQGCKEREDTLSSWRLCVLCPLRFVLSPPGMNYMGKNAQEISSQPADDLDYSSAT